MENKEVARIFDDIADILEVKGGNPFRIRSFRRSAQIIAALGFKVTRALDENINMLRAVDGIGEGTISKIREIAETGTCKEWSLLTAEFPPSLLPLVRLQSVGPKKVHLFWKTLGITTMTGLEEAAREQRLRSLPGLGEKSEGKILKAIEDFRQSQGRVQLREGIDSAQAIVDFLQSRVKVHRIAAAGSVRRLRETIGDIDVLVSCEEPGRAIDSFVSYPLVAEILARGSTKASVQLRSGMNCDLRVLEDDSFGAALQYFTGSKDHNVKLRERAKRMGFKISEYGLFRIEDEERVAGSEEAEIYHLLGLPYIVPELRENRGELDIDGQDLPNLIRSEDIRGDLHMHTEASDGKYTIEDMALAARDLGYEYIAITDHSQALAMVRGLDEERLLAQMEEIDQINSRISDIQILKGIEVDILADGSLDLDNEVLSRLDMVIASVHSRFEMGREEMTDRICRALANPHVNLLAHPTGRLLLRREPYPLELERIIRTACDNRVCLEINSHPKRLDLSDVNCRMARDMGALISINSDAHHVRGFQVMSYGIFTARRGWLEAGDVINTFPLEKLVRVLRKEEYRV